MYIYRYLCFHLYLYRNIVISWYCDTYRIVRFLPIPTPIIYYILYINVLAFFHFSSVLYSFWFWLPWFQTSSLSLLSYRRHTQDAPELTLPEVDENVQIRPFDDQYAHVFYALAEVTFLLLICLRRSQILTYFNVAFPFNIMRKTELKSSTEVAPCRLEGCTTSGVHSKTKPW